jgi:HSP20 family protein
MAVARWTPFQNLQALQEEMNRRFNDAFRGGNGEETSVGQHQWSPPVDIYETEDALILDVDLPGVSKDQVSIEIHQNILTLRGQRPHQADRQDDRYHRVERTYGTFHRAFTLSIQVDQEKVQATYRDGVLTLRLPKVEAAKPKRIAING